MSTYVNSRFLLISILLSVLFACDKDFSQIIEEYGPDKGLVLKDTSLTIDPSVQSVLVNYDLVQIEIPENAFGESAKLTITEYDPAEEEQFDDFQYGPVYDITIEGHKQFSRDLRISLDYHNDQIPEKFENGLFPMFYNDSLEKWERFLIYEVDTAANQVIIKTRHLTKLSWFSPKRLQGYTDFEWAGSFYIYYVASDIQTNASYNSPNAALYTHSKTPHFIEDMNLYLHEALIQYRSYFMVWYFMYNNIRFNVFIDDITGEGKTDPITNSITIDNSLNPNELRSVCAHELMHVLQDSYYNMVGSGISNTHWWLEATAVNADRFVWKTLIKNEETEVDEHFLDLSMNLANSWDDCDTDPDYYRAGCFLSYISWYRGYLRHPETQHILPVIPLDSMLIYVGENGSLSSVSATLAEYLSSRGHDLGDLYDEFLRWTIGQSGNRQLYLTDQRGGHHNWQETITVSNENPKKSSVLTVPSLGIRGLKIFNTFNVSESIKVEVLNAGPDVEFYLCGETANSKGVFSRSTGPVKLDLSSPTVLNLHGSDTCLDILCINHNLSTDQEVSIIVTSMLKVHSLEAQFHMYTASNNGGNLIYTFDVDESYPAMLEWKTKDYDSYSFFGTATESFCVDSPETTVELVVNQDCSEIVSLKVHAFHCSLSGFSGDQTVDFVIQNFPITDNGNGGRSGKVTGGDAWQYLKSFSMTGPDGTVSGVFYRDAGSLSLGFK